MSKVLVLRTANKDLKSYGGFQWPEKGYVSCPDWNPRPECGGGLHGLLWGKGDYSLLSEKPTAKWQVVEVDEDKIVRIGEDKCKFPEGYVLYTGNMAEAMTMVLTRTLDSEDCAINASSRDYATNASRRDHAANASSGNYATNVSSGDYAKNASCGNYAVNASSGDHAKNVSSGYYAKNVSSGNFAKNASSGDHATNASCGYYAANASSGDYAKNVSSGYGAANASSGYYAKNVSSGAYAKNASSGNYSLDEAKGEHSVCMQAGIGGIVSAGEHGCFACAWWDENSGRYRIAVGYVGEDGIKPHTRYTVKDGKFVEAEENHG